MLVRDMADERPVGAGDDILTFSGVEKGRLLPPNLPLPLVPPWEEQEAGTFLLNCCQRIAAPREDYE